MKLCQDDPHDIHIKMGRIAGRISVKLLRLVMPLWFNITAWVQRVVRFK